MKPLFSFACLALAIQISYAQSEADPFASRSDLIPELAPFYHGVASGDPLPDAMIIWTRLTTSETTPQNINWRMATDTLFTNVVASGTGMATPESDWTLKVDVSGLTHSTWYYYDFEYNGDHSLIGRTRTAASGNNDHARFAVLSCSSYEHGFFNTYRNIVDRNEVDAVLHLGDYIYEYEAGGYSSNMTDRDVEPTNEIISLSDYRTRYSHYRLDPDLIYIHQQFPFINVWDDHETANNSYNGGAGNHTEGGEGAWVDRMGFGAQANDEWLPMRKPDPNDSLRIFRSFEYGDLADIIMLDTRLYGRDEQGSGTDEDRSLLGDTQRQWFFDELGNSTAQWKVVGQQVMIAPMTLFGAVLNDDQWDGYPAERDTLINFLSANGIDNMVVLTGDIHTSWANDIPMDGYDAGTGANSAGVEFVCTSVTSPGLDILDIPIPNPEVVIQTANPHMKYIDLTRKGYLVLDLTADKAQSDWVYVSTITDHSFTEDLGESWFTDDGTNHLQEAGQPSPPITDQQYLAPSIFNQDTATGVGVTDVSLAPVMVGAYPNPFEDRLVIQFNIFEPDDVVLEVSDMTGRIVHRDEITAVKAGLSYIELNAAGISSGVYSVSLTTKTGICSNRVVKR